jgi:bla regulator protein blaR1
VGTQSESWTWGLGTMIKARVLVVQFGSLLVAACYSVVAMSLLAQSSAPAERATAVAPQLPAFDVVSIKPHKDEGMMMRAMSRLTPDGVQVDGVPLGMLVRQAFGVSEDRILNEPDWAKSARYDIEAKVAPEDAAGLKAATPQQRSAMMLPVLQDRFGLKYHHETKELQVYTLVVAKGGPKLKEAKPVDASGAGAAHQAKADAGADTPPRPLYVQRPPSGGEGAGPVLAKPGTGGADGGPVAMKPGAGGGGPRMMMRGSPQGMTMEGHGTTMPALAQMLSQQMGATVVDKTGLTGSYDVTLSFMPDNFMFSGQMMKGPGGGPGPDGGAQSQEPVGPSIFTAVQEQLGLKLVAQKAPVDVVVIDHIERPTEN